MLRNLIIATVIVFAASACGAEHDNPSENLGRTGADSPTNIQLTFVDDILPIVQQRCSLCHSQGSALPFWEDYDVIVAKKDLVRHRVFVTQDMPRGNATNMVAEERDKMATWIDQGALFE